ncbi:MAG: ABC transporter permease [Thermoanaerobaculia bacterium]
MIAAIVKTGWLNLRRDRAALMLSFVVPVVFFSIFAGIFGAQRSKTPKVTMAVADLDGSVSSKRLVAALRNESALKILESPKDSKQPFDAKSAEEYVHSGNAPVALLIPKGFGGSGIRFGGAATGPQFQLLTDSADPIAEQVASGLLQKTIITAMPDMMMKSGTEAIDQWSGGLTAQQRTNIDQSIGRFQAMQAAPTTQASTSANSSLVNIKVTDIVGQNKKNSVAALYAAGIGVMFLLFTATNAGGALLDEIESGTLDRILSTRVTMTQLLLGKMAYLWTLGMIQLIVMFVWGAIAFKLDLVHHLGGFLIMALATTFCTSAFGLFLASLSRTRAQLGAISTLIVLSVSALGGSMFPRFLMPEAMQKAGLVLFNSWALEGFTNVFWREEPLSSLVLPVLVLIGFAVAFFAVARQLVKKWEIA